MSTLSKSVVTFILLSSTSFPSFSQTGYKWMVGINGGTFIYQGDLTPSLIGSYKTASPAYGFSIARIMNAFFAIRGNAAFGKLQGNDAVYNNPSWRKSRALNFSTPVTEFAAHLVWNPFGNNNNEIGMKCTPYLFAGGGVNLVSINRDFSKLDTTIFSFNTKTAAGLTQDAVINPPRSLFVLPVGAGVAYSLGSRWSMNYELAFRYTFSDYVDGFSQVANPNQKDYYHSHTLGLVYRFGASGDKYSDKTGCPVIKY